MVKPYSKGYLKRCLSRAKFNDFLFMCVVVAGIIAVFTIHSLALVACLCLIVPYCINRIPSIFNENSLHKQSVIEAKVPVCRMPLNERAFHNTDSYVFGYIEINGRDLHIGRSYYLPVKSVIEKVYIANYNPYAAEITGIVFDESNKIGRKLVTISLYELKSNFISPTGVECMYEADIGIRGMTKVAQDHYFK